MRPLETTTARLPLAVSSSSFRLEWAGALADELKAAADRGEPDDGSRYYQHWLAALERLVTQKGLTNRDAMEERKEAWAEAYRHTPHGKPVELASGLSEQHHEHS